MSYTVNIVGHKDTASEDESIAFELEQADNAREAIHGLDGVMSASFSGGHIGGVDLLASPATPEAPAAEEPTPEPSAESGTG